MKKAKCQEWINVFAELEDLHDKGWLTDKEFAAKEDSFLPTLIGFLAMELSPRIKERAREIAEGSKVMLISCEREISKEVYDRAVKNRNFIAKEDEDTVFTEAERWGYGVYGDRVFEKDGKYFVAYERGDSCD